MKVSKTFVNEKNSDKKINDYLTRVEYVQKPYDEEELGIGATVTLPEFYEILEKTWEEGTKKGLLNDSTNKYKFALNTINKLKELGIGAADKPLKYAGLSVEELEKKLLEDYTTLQ